MQLMEKQDYSEITISEICSKAGVTRMSFYRNFESKEDILKKWIIGVTDDFVSFSGISYKNDSLQEYFVKLFTHMLNYRAVCDSLYHAGLVHLVKSEFDRVFLAVYRGEYDDYKSFFLAGGIYNVFLLWLINGYKEEPKQLAKRLAGILEK